MTFARTALHKYIKLGSRQKSKRRYVKARGKHNKIRQKERGRPVRVEIGFKNKVTTRGLIEDKRPILVYNLDDLKKVGKENIVIIGKIGRKKKLEIAKKAKSAGLEIFNLNINKLIRNQERLEKEIKPQTNKK